MNWLVVKVRIQGVNCATSKSRVQGGYLSANLTPSGYPNEEGFIFCIWIMIRQGGVLLFPCSLSCNSNFLHENFLSPSIRSISARANTWGFLKFKPLSGTEQFSSTRPVATSNYGCCDRNETFSQALTFLHHPKGT